jgi:hypothetical protein
VSALRAAHGVRAAVRLVLEAEQNVLEGAVVHLVLRHQPRRLLHLARALLQLRDDRILRITHLVSAPSFSLNKTHTHLYYMGAHTQTWRMQKASKQSRVLLGIHKKQSLVG